MAPAAHHEDRTSAPRGRHSTPALVTALVTALLAGGGVGAGLGARGGGAHHAPAEASDLRDEVHEELAEQRRDFEAGRRVDAQDRARTAANVGKVREEAASLKAHVDTKFAEVDRRFDELRDLIIRRR
jgi:hypothetical protein